MYGGGKPKKNYFSIEIMRYHVVERKKKESSLFIWKLIIYGTEINFRSLAEYRRRYRKKFARSHFLFFHFFVSLYKISFFNKFTCVS